MKFSELQRLQRREGITVLSADERIEQLEARLRAVTKERDALRASKLPDGLETDLFIVEHAMRMNNWDWNSDTSDDLKRSAYKIISKLLAATEAKP